MLTLLQAEPPAQVHMSLSVVTVPVVTSSESTISLQSTIRFTNGLHGRTIVYRMSLSRWSCTLKYLSTVLLVKRVALSIPSYFSLRGTLIFVFCIFAYQFCVSARLCILVSRFVSEHPV